MATVLQIGPIVGHTTDQTTRVWFLPEDRTKTYVVRLWEYPHGEDELAWRWEKGAGTFTRADGLGLGASPSAKEEAVAPPSSRPASGDVFGTRIAYFKGLKSATRYFYDVVEAGDVGVGPPLLAPSLRTLPDATAIAAHDDGEDPTKPRFAYVSCAGLDLLPGLPGTPANGPNAPESLISVHTCAGLSVEPVVLLLCTSLAASGFRIESSCSAWNAT